MLASVPTFLFRFNSYRPTRSGAPWLRRAIAISFLLSAAGLAGCAGLGSTGGNSGQALINILFSSSTLTIQTSQSHNFSVTVQNDPKSLGVSWSLSGSGCSGASCGTFTNSTSTSVTYNAPAQVPNPPAVSLIATSLADPSRSAAATITLTAAPQPISVAVTPASLSVQVSAAANFAATLQNDSQNQGVSWSLSGSGCSGTSCGTLTNVTTTSVTYEAPSALPSPALVTLTATANADKTKSATSSITITSAAQPISVSVNPLSTSIQVSRSSVFSALVQNDSQNKGVTWSLSGAGCSGSACGTLTNVTTSSVTYTAPAALPNPASVTLTATSIADTTKSAAAAITLTVPPPSVPANLTAVANSSSQIALSWSASTDLLGISAYLVERCQGAGCSNFAQIASTGSTSFNDTGLAASTSYSYRVRAEDSANNLSAYSSTASATTDASSGGGSTPTFVWSKSAANTTGLNINSYSSNLPTSGTLAGNVVIATFQYAVGSGASAAVKDDKGDTFTLLASNSNGNQTVATYCAAPTTGARVLTITFSGGSPAYVAMINASEWYNLTCALDGTSINSSSSASVSAGSIATTSDGDLIYQAAEEDGNTGTEQWTPGASPWSLLSACSGLANANTPQAAQYQVQATHGSISPAFSMSAADSWNSVAVALKPASAGTAPPAGIRILHLQEEAIPTGLGGSITVQFPSSGNLLIDATIDCPDCDITGISDSNHNTHASAGPALNNSLSGSVQTFYAANAITSNSLSLTFTLPGSPAGGSDFFLFDVTGAAASPFDSTAGRQTATGDFAASSGSGTSTVNGPSITPSTPNGLIITQIAVDTNTISNVSNGLSSVFFAGSIPNPIGQTNPLNENNGWAFDFNATTASRQYVWSTIGVGVNFWASTAVAFKAQ